MGNGEIELKTSKTKTFKEKKITAFLDEYANNDLVQSLDKQFGQYISVSVKSLE